MAGKSEGVGKRGVEKRLKQKSNKRGKDGKEANHNYLREKEGTERTAPEGKGACCNCNSGKVSKSKGEWLWREK